MAKHFASARRFRNGKKRETELEKAAPLRSNFPQTAPMSDPFQNNASSKSLSAEDLRAMARRHGVILKKFRMRRERELAARAQQAMAYSMARQMAAAMMTASRERADFSASPSGKVFAGTPAASAIPSPRRTEKTRSAGTGGAPEKVAAESHFVAPEQTRTEVFLRKIGGTGLAFSLAFHAVLIICALLWVVSVYVAPPKSEPTFFATGSGGGRGGDRPSYADVQASRKSRAGKVGAGAQARKIVSSAKSSRVVLPEIPQLPQAALQSGEFASMNLLRGLGSTGTLSSGAGGGLGGGVGAGFGAGIGNARNFVGRFKATRKILGTDVTAERLAVYMDISGSMTEVLPVVRADILKKFPTADLYEYFGCGMSRIENAQRTKSEAAAWERKKKRLLTSYDREKNSATAKKTQTVDRRAARKSKKSRKGVPVVNEYSSAWKEKLSAFGQALLADWEPRGNASFASAELDLGNWLNMVLTEGGYDALIVFADFQDYRDGRIAGEQEVLGRWLAQARENGQRLYFFTTEMLPQEIFRTLAELSGGEIALPKETAKSSNNARETEKTIKKMNRLKGKKSANGSGVPARAAAVDDDGEDDDDGNATDFSEDGDWDEDDEDEDRGGFLSDGNDDSDFGFDDDFDE